MANEENQVGSSAQDREGGSATDDLNVSLYWPPESTDSPQRLRSEPANRLSGEGSEEGSQVVGRTAALQASLRSLGARIDAIGGHVDGLVTWAEQQRQLTDDLRHRLESLQRSDPTGPRPVLDALARIEALAEAIAESQPEPVNLTSVHETLGRLEQRPTPATTDLTPIHESLARLEELAEALAESQPEPTDPAPALRELTQTVQRGTEQAVDRAALQDAVARIEHTLDQRPEPVIDESVLEKLTALAAQLDAVGERISSRERPMAALDPATIDALADAVATRLRSRSGRPDRPLRGAQPGHPEG